MMAQFSNGNDLMQAESVNCDLCLHQENDEGGGCVVTLLHLTWCNTNSDTDDILDNLWPMESTPHGMFPGKCKMFASKFDRAIVDAIDYLRQDEGNYVTICCDNPDDIYNCAVDVRANWERRAVFGDLNGYRCSKERFVGKSILECLTKAVEAMKKSAFKEDEGGTQ